MKILLKEKIRGILSSFEQANDYFETVTEKENALNVCITCQETAQKLGEIIEQNEEDPKGVIRCLVDYSELIYQLYQADWQDWKHMTERLRQQVEHLKERVERDLTEEKMKVVFLPYNASMWDTFDSICRCAKQDPKFKVDVIPIPYFSLGKNREILEERYEGEQIGAFTEITDYKQYDMKSERPDIVFIHNPYDQYNRVTQIHSGFFSSELVKYTSHLVYIPYYISKAKTLEDMLEMPGVRKAWRIFVDSEAVRRQYIKSGIEEDRVIASGSPKFDMVFKALKEYTHIPDEWDVLKGKRVFFYNTHLNGIINAGEEFIRNIQYIFSVFRERKDIALLWRPHPLSIETVKAMNPGILSEYMKLVEDIKSGSYGVYDDTAKLERTIAISHAYIGEDASSVSRLYEATGKPIYYVENCHSVLSQKERYARCLCAECCNGKVYMFSWEYNRIFIINERDGSIRWETGNEAYGEYEKNLYTHSVLDGSNIYFIPCMASSIMKYNTVTSEKEFIETGTSSMAYYPVVYNRKMYLMPIYYSKVFLLLDLDTNKITCHSLESPLKEKGGAHNILLLYGGAAAKGCIWMACQIGPYVQKYDVDKNLFSFIQVEGLEHAIRSMSYDGTFFWCIAQYGNKIYKWDPVDNRIVGVISVKELSDWQNEMLFADIQYADNTIYAFLRNLNLVVIVDVLTDNVHMLDYSQLIIQHDVNNRIQMFSENARIYKKHLYLFPFHANGVIKVNLETKEIIFQETGLNQKRLLEGLSGNILNEGMCNLEVFLNWQQMNPRSSKLTELKTVGEKVWDSIKKDL